MPQTLLKIVLLSVCAVYCHSLSSAVTRRQLLIKSSTISLASIQAFSSIPLAFADVSDEETDLYNYNQRDRKGNKQAVIREDYWYMIGKIPPRRLDGPLKADDPQFNAFGACESSVGGSNPCTYVSLSLRIPAYSKYAFAISYGSKEFEKLGKVLHKAGAANAVADSTWYDAENFLAIQERSPPPAIIDAELKMVLFATAMLTSPNFPGPGRELLVARFYANEAHFAAQEMKEAIRVRDATRAAEAWKFGRDSWNSYFNVVNRSISPKVGDPFEPIQNMFV